MANSPKPSLTQAKNTRDINILLAQLARLTDAHGVLANQMNELAMVQLNVSATAQNADNYVQEAIPTILGALDEFDARLKILEEKLGVPIPVLDNEGKTT